MNIAHRRTRKQSVELWFRSEEVSYDALHFLYRAMLGPDSTRRTRAGGLHYANRAIA